MIVYLHLITYFQLVVLSKPSKCWKAPTDSELTSKGSLQILSSFTGICIQPLVDSCSTKTFPEIHFNILLLLSKSVSCCETWHETGTSSCTGGASFFTAASLNISLLLLTWTCIQSFTFWEDKNWGGWDNCIQLEIKLQILINWIGSDTKPLET